MKIKAILLFLFICYGASAQNTANPPNTEWDQLDKAFVAVFKALESKDYEAFQKVTLSIIDCADCVGKPEFNESGNLVTSKIFFVNIAGGLAKSQLYKSLTTRGYTFSIAEIKDFKPRYFPRDYPNNLKLYEVWIPTYKAGELSKNHPGSSHAFQFVKINGQFKLYGLISIP